MQVLELWRWPVTGAGGESIPSVRLDARGVGGDHAHAVLVGGDGGWAAAADHPALARWRAAYPFAIGAALDPAAPPYAVLISPAGRAYTWGDPRLRTALAEALGGPVRLERGGAPRAVRVTVPGDAGAPGHVHVDADPAALRPGRELRFEGGVRLRLVAPAAAGAGVRARVLAAGRIAAGAAVELADPPAR